MSDTTIVVNVDFGETRVALIHGGIISELLIERRNQRSMVGNVYRAKAVRVLPGMHAAFLDIGLDRNAFLHGDDLSVDDELGPEGDGEGGGKKGGKPGSIAEQISAGDSLLVQVSKDPISTKGARVTTRISLPGRHLVYLPTGERGGVSRKITDDAERKRLAKILKRLAPERGVLIARTAANGASADALEADVSYLVELWEGIVAAHEGRRKPGLLREELDLPLRMVRDRLDDSVKELVVDDQPCFDRVRALVDRLMPMRLDAVRYYRGDEPIYDAFGIESEIQRALGRRVELPSGGSLIIDQAEALTAIDVNTGKFVGKGSKDQEETILATNLEAVEEIAYQLRFRNIGGLIVLDLIDMDRSRSRKQVLEKLKELLKRDRAKTSVVRISEFGLVEMTRERTRESLGRTLHEPCLYCDGTGHVLSRETIANEIIREVRRRHDTMNGELEVRLHPLVREVFQGEGAAMLKALEQRIGRKLSLTPDDSTHIEKFQLRARR